MHVVFRIKILIAVTFYPDHSIHPRRLKQPPTKNRSEVLKRTALILLLSLLGLYAIAQQDRPGQEEKPLELLFAPQGGFYEQGVEVKLICPGAEIYYTLDGSLPTPDKLVYEGPIQLSATTVIRAVAYLDGKKSLLSGQTYFIDEPATTFPVVSIGVTDALLFDPRKGLFMQGGTSRDTLWHKPGANFWSRKEARVHIDIFESDGKLVHSSLTGMRLFGGMSRLFPQKSLALVARKQYGASRFDYPIFGDDGPKDVKFMVLRNSGSDFSKTHFRDALMTGLLDEWDIDKQAYRPAHVYINGKYWGIYNIREKVNRFFIADHHDVDKDSIDLLEHKGQARRGSIRHYRHMLSFIEKKGLIDSSNFAYVQKLMDVDNFMNYQIAQIYYDNQDAGGNIKYWRPRTPGGRWRWILYDTDWGFGLQTKKAYKNNSLAFHTEPNGPHWPNPPWSTFLLRKLLENPAFRVAFVNRFADHLNTTFEADRVLNRIDDFYFNLEPEMPRHLQRWNLSSARWNEQVDVLRAFAQERPRYMRMHLMEKFNTGALRQVEAVATVGGTILINGNVRVRDRYFQGIYFERYPITFKVIPDYGYRFAGWEGAPVPDDRREFKLVLKEKKYVVKARFERFEDPLAGKIMINEICANNKRTGDWVELYNHSDGEVSLRNWILTDGKNEFVFPDVRIGPKDYLIVCRDGSKFIRNFPEAYNVIGGLGFGLNKRRETLALFSHLGASVDSIGYDIPLMDTVFTLSLLLPNLDNSDPGNWEQRLGPGSPNLPNPHYVESSIQSVQTQWMQIGVAAAVLILALFALYLRNRGIL